VCRGSAVAPIKGLDNSRKWYVYVGEYSTKIMHQLDYLTGKQIKTYALGGYPYGAAYGEDGTKQYIYIQDSGSGVERLDIVKGTVESIGSAPGGQYGITVGSNGNPYVNSSGTSVWDKKTKAWSAISGADSNVVGMATYGDFVYSPNGACAGSGGCALHKINIKTNLVAKDLSMPGGCKGPSAVGPTPKHKAGSVICVSWGSPGRVSLVDIKTEKTEFVDLGTSPYTYSDFTGYALKGALAPIGTLVQPFGCGTEWTKYTAVDTEFDYIGSGKYTVYVRAGDDPVALKKAPWVFLYKNPALSGTLDPALQGTILEVRVDMEGESSALKPILASLGVTSTCSVIH
jgi:hypothetical protein